MNISLNDERISLNEGLSYYIIDALYVDDIRASLQEDSQAQTEEAIRKNIFPYLDTPFAKIKMQYPFFDSKFFKKIKSDFEFANENVFSIDTGLVLFIEESLFIDFSSKFSYDNLVDETPINYMYWESVEIQYGKGAVGLMLATGKSNPEFNGSGSFIIS